MIDWLNPDYTPVFKQRLKSLQVLRSDPGLIAPLKEYYKQNPADFINDWGMTFDPRMVEIGKPATMPFLLFPKQREYIEWLHNRWKSRESGLCDKSRDMGLSWLSVAFAHWMWFFYPGTVIGFGSRKEEYVDKLGEPKSLFWKLRKYIELMPYEFTPHGFDERKHASYMRIVNPESDSFIVGEAGSNIGRGARTSIYFKDESAFYEQAKSVDAALSQTSNCKIDISTSNGSGNEFFKKRHSGKISVFTFHWTSDPRKNQAWYDKQKDELDAVILAQEVDIDYNASTNDSYISGRIVEAAQQNGPADIDSVGKWIIGVDAAHEGNDKSIIHARKGRLNLEQRVLSQVRGDVLAGAVVDFIDILIKTDDDLHQIVIELDGPGASCYDHLKNSKYADKIKGVHTGVRLKDDRNYNVRAKLHRNARDYLEDGSVCLFPDTEFKSQISSIKYSYRDGLLLMQSKKEYKSSFSKSPDKSDAFILTFGADDNISKKSSRSGRLLNGWMG